jgi:ABC-type antimicrobial peptide transport system permease subunit
MLGIVVGITSVITIVSLGEGVKRQIVGQLNHFGKDIITVRPGGNLQQNASSPVSILAGQGLQNGSLSRADWDGVSKLPYVGASAPISFINASAKTDEQEYPQGAIIGTTSQLPFVLNQKVEFGAFFDSAESAKHIAIIGNRVAEQLFHENIPIGRVMNIRGEEFVVRGVFEQFGGSPVTLGADLNSAIFIPYEVAQQISGGSAQIAEIIVKPSDAGQFNRLAAEINRYLLMAHGGQVDFSVLTESQNANLNARIINTFTELIAGIAAISLFVGGIGIMNIMLVSVTERTREIGIRKAVGATNRQLLNQFLVEALVLSGVGGILGVVVSLFANYLLRVFSPFSPVITWQVLVFAVGTSIVIGVIFGVTPAFRAARKDPIDALRHE